MKRQINIQTIIQFCGAFAVILVVIFSAIASAVRPVPVSLSANGEILGGYFDITGVGGGRVYQGSVLTDTTPEGDLIVFNSNNSAENFVPGVLEFQNPPAPDVFVRNVRTGEIFCISCQVAQGLYRAASGSGGRISANGRYVVYSGLNLNSANSNTQIYRFDLQTGIAELVSGGTTAGTDGNSNSLSPVVSGDGRYVAFISSATNLVTGYPAANTSRQVFVRDMQNGQTVLASHGFNTPATPGNAEITLSSPISISDNGRFVVWTSPASNYLFLNTDGNNLNDVFFFDVLSTGVNIGAASLSTTGVVTANGASFGGIVSAQSSQLPPTIVFSSNATDLNTADTNSTTDIYCYKGEATARLVSISSSGTSANAASVDYPSVSRNGRFVAFSSKASNLVNGTSEPNAATSDIFLRDLQTNTTRYVSLNSQNQPSSSANGTFFPITQFAIAGNTNFNKNISDDGRFVAFATTEPLSVRDSGSTPDIYVRDMNAGISILATLSKTLAGGQNGFLDNSFSGLTVPPATISPIAISAGGRRVSFTAGGTNLAANDLTFSFNTKVFQSTLSLLSSRPSSDFNNDSKNDFAVFRQNEGRWYSLFDAGNNGFETILLGESTDRIAPGDYDGDGQTDYAIFTPTTGRWDILQSLDNAFVSRFFGTSTDIIAPADFDGDGRTDLAYFRPSNATWYILQSNSSSLKSVKFGLNGDIPSVGDFDGDNRADIAIFRPSSGDWWILQSSNNSINSFHWGANGDKPAAGDYDGDGKTDACVFRNGFWYIFNSRDNSNKILQFGLNNDRIVPSDYDGDGKTDIAVFRPSNGFWYVLKSTDNNLMQINWGMNGDVPIAAAFLQ